MITVIGSFAFAGAFLAVGRWGRRNAPDLVPVTLSADARATKERSLRRGARSITVLGWLFAVLGVVASFGAAFDGVAGTTR